MKRVQGTHLKYDTLPCLVVKPSCGKKEESVRKKDINLSTEKESLKGSRKDRLLQREREGRKERTTLKCRQKRIFTRFSTEEVCQEDRNS